MFDVVEYKKALFNSETINDCNKVPIPKMGCNQNYIFISYSHLDYKEVYADLAEMYACGVRFWYDKGLSAGKEWDEEVASKIESANCVGVIFYMSENLFKSESANKEIQITYDVSSREKEGIKKNYFGVNLTKKTAAELLMSAMASSNGTLSMKHINTLSSAFSDKATYLDYNSPEHITELISQIEMQFQVIDKANNDDLTIELDNSISDTVITFFADVVRNDDIIKAQELLSFLTDIGHAAYITETAVTGSKEYNEFVMKQNEYKVKQCKNIIFIAPELLMSVYHRQLEELIENTDKNVFLYVDSRDYIKAYPVLDSRCIVKDSYKEVLRILL